jgi:guanylate kinase
VPPSAPPEDHPSRPSTDSRARLTVLSGPSGVGKGTVVAAVRRRYPSIWVSVSVTTRSPRPGEINGVHYRFVSSAEYDRMVAAGELLEHATFAGNGYGTPRAPVEDRIAAGLPTLLEIELQGARQVRLHDPDAQLVFLLPPSWEELEQRLRGRGTETEAVVSARLDRARLEMDAVGEFDQHIVNDDVERAAAELVSLVQSVCSPPVPAGPSTDLDADHDPLGPPSGSSGGVRAGTHPLV